MKQFVTRFRLGNVKPFRIYVAPAGKSMGVIPAEECTFTPAVQVGFDAEQGEPFGANTPSGSVVMSIYNAEIAEALIALFHAHMCDRTAGSKPPLFEVTFRRVED